MSGLHASGDYRLFRALTTSATVGEVGNIANPSSKCLIPHWVTADEYDTYLSTKSDYYKNNNNVETGVPNVKVSVSGEPAVDHSGWTLGRAYGMAHSLSGSNSILEQPIFKSTSCCSLSCWF